MKDLRMTVFFVILLIAFLFGLTSGSLASSQPQQNETAFEEMLISKSPWSGRWFSIRTAWHGFISLGLARDKNGKLIATLDGSPVESLTIGDKSVEFAGTVPFSVFQVKVSFNLELINGQLVGTGYTDTGYNWSATLSPASAR